MMSASTPGTVVVVEDDRAVNHAIEALLEAVGYRHRSYASAEAFLESEPPRPPCCLITDFRLPGMDGMELQSRLARRVTYMPVLLLSGDVSDRQIRQALRNGAYTFMRKPFDPDDLLVRTDRALAVSESELVTRN